VAELDRRRFMNLRDSLAARLDETELALVEGRLVHF